MLIMLHWFLQPWLVITFQHPNLYRPERTRNRNTPITQNGDLTRQNFPPSLKLQDLSLLMLALDQQQL
jgi:hypothetical protein